MRLILLVALIGCSRAPTPAAAPTSVASAASVASASAPPTAAAPTSIVSAPPAADPRDQRALAEAIRAADQTDDPHAALLKIRRDWIGRRYTWQARYQAILCRSPQTCHVIAFERAQRDRDIVQGWMPRLNLDEASHAALVKRCAKIKRCEIRFRGTLSQLTLAEEVLPAVGFADVELLPDR